MSINLIAIHYDNSLKNVIGFKLFESTEGKIMDVPYNNVVSVLKEKKATVNGIELNGSTLKGNNGAFDRYPKVVNGNLYGTSPMVVLKQIGAVGYYVCDWSGNCKIFKNEDVITLANSIGIANGKVVTRADGTTFISAINGSYEYVDIKPEEKQKDNKSNINLQEANNVSPKKINTPENNKNTVVNNKTLPISGNKIRDKYSAPVVSGKPLRNTGNKEFDDKSAMTVEQKLTTAMYALRQNRTYYYSVLSSLKVIETKEIKTMGVTLDTLYYNPNFVKEITVPSLIFVLMHEALHVVMQHSLRKRSKKHLIWNIACDFFINKLLVEELGIIPGDAPIKLKNTNNLKAEESSLKYYITVPNNALYNKAVNTTNETPERIYEEIIKAAEEQKDKDQSQDGQGQEQEGQGQSGQGKGKDSQGKEHEDQGQRQDGQEQDGQEQGQEQGQDSQEQDSEGQAGRGRGKGQDGQGHEQDGEGHEQDGEGHEQDGGGQSNSGGNTEAQKELENKEFRGKKIGGLSVVDLVEDDRENKLTEKQKEDISRKVLERAAATQRQLGCGTGTGGALERLIMVALAPKVNWKALLKSKLTKSTQAITTFSNPDRRFIYKNNIYPGHKKLQNDTLENIKVCIDTSGSISDEDLAIALSQIKQLLDEFNAEAEVMYWDTDIRVTAPFTTIKELMKIKPAGGGGTDVNCVFSTFEQGDYKKRKKKQPSIIIIFTDGVFGPVQERFRKYRDTIWVIHGGYKFQKPFGHQAKLKDAE